MASLEEITERLLERSNEAIEQLDEWILLQNKNRHISENKSGLDSIERLDDKYTEFLEKLNSLYIRSQYIKDKIRTEKNAKATKRKSELNTSRIQELMLEFKEITLSLNEIAQQDDETNSKQLSPVSTSTKSSLESFTPKPLKILNRASMIRSPINSPPKKRNISFCPIHENLSVTEYESLPSSPNRSNLLEEQEQVLHPARSFQTGLRTEKARKPDKNQLDKYFKDKQRLSLTLFGSADADDGESLNDNDYSDEETVIFTSSSNIETDAITDDMKPIRRCNSHESVLSVHNKFVPKNNNNLQFQNRLEPFGRYLATSHNRNFTIPSIQNIQVSGTSTLSRFSREQDREMTQLGSKTSKDLLTSVMTATPITTQRNNKLTFFDKFNSMFNFSTISEEQKTTVEKNRSAESPRNDFVSIEELNEALTTNMVM